MREDTATRLIDALALLLVRLHLLGFYWGDVSLSNTLFRRDAGEFAAYLVDAETGELHPELTPGQREYDVDLARTNIIGELMDLQAGGYFPLESDPVDVGDRIRTSTTCCGPRSPPKNTCPMTSASIWSVSASGASTTSASTWPSCAWPRTTPVSTSSFSRRWSTRDTTTASSCA